MEWATLTQLLGAVGFTAVVTELIRWVAGRRGNSATARKSDAEAAGVLSDKSLAWVERFEKAEQRAEARANEAETEAKAAKAEAASAYTEARAATQRAEELQRDRDRDRAALDDLRREFEVLLDRIAACPAGRVCPVADFLTRNR